MLLPCSSQIPLPSRPHWYLLFGASEEEIKEICITTLRLYTRKKVVVVFYSSSKEGRTLLSWNKLKWCANASQETWGQSARSQKFNCRKATPLTHKSSSMCSTEILLDHKSLPWCFFANWHKLTNTFCILTPSAPKWIIQHRGPLMHFSVTNQNNCLRTWVPTEACSAQPKMCIQRTIWAILIKLAGDVRHHLPNNHTSFG